VAVVEVVVVVAVVVLRVVLVLVVVIVVVVVVVVVVAVVVVVLVVVVVHFTTSKVFKSSEFCTKPPVPTMVRNCPAPSYDLLPKLTSVISTPWFRI